MMKLPILFEDNHIIVVEKQPGIPSQEDQTGDPDMLTIIKEDLKIRYQKPGNVYLGLVHRLDRPVGGAMIFAKTSKAASRLSDAVRTRKFGKSYICVVEGVPPRQEAELSHYIRKDEKINQVTVFDRPTADAKDARLTYRVIASVSGFSLVAVELHTGRPHQIRAQMAHIGHPLVGDLKYGSKQTHIHRAHGHIALWSTMIQVPHPISKEIVEFSSLPPQAHEPWHLFTAQQLQQAARWFI